MAYIVVKHFTDLQDDGYKYAEGDTYPRKGYEPSAERIEMLSTKKNRQKTVLIEAIPETSTEELEENQTAEQLSKEEVVAEVAADEEKTKEKPKRKRKKN